MKLTKRHARRVLEVVDAGLTNGVGTPEPGHMCVEAAVCYALGMPHGDEPECVHPVIRAFKIRLNDSRWSSNEARAKGMRRTAIAQLGSTDIDAKKWRDYVVEQTMRQIVPIALRAAAERQKDKIHAERLIEAALRCESEGTRESVIQARDAAAAYTAAAADAYTAAADADAADAADAYTAAAAAAYTAAAAAAAADAAAADAADAARDKTLTVAAEICVQACILCKTQGSKWLDICE